MNRSYSGEYTCKAYQISEIMTQVEEQTVRLIVQCRLSPSNSRLSLINIFASDKPSIHGNHNSTKYGFIDGEVNLTCIADGKPRPEFLWFRNGKKVNNNVYHYSNFSVLQASFGEVNLCKSFYKCDFSAGSGKV